MTPAFAIETLGCKVNQYESSFLIEQLTQAGLRQAPFNQRAEVYIVHSCAVTVQTGSIYQQDSKCACIDNLVLWFS